MVMRPGISVFTGSPLQDITPEIVNLQQQLNNLSTVLGDLTALPTADKTSLVNSLKEVNNGLGNLSNVKVYASMPPYNVSANGQNQTSGIQAAIDFAYSNDGGTVVLPKGTLLVTTITKNWTASTTVNIEGAGKKATILSKFDSSTTPIFNFTTPSNQLETYSDIRELSINGNNKTHHGIQLDSCARFNIFEVDIRNCDHAIHNQGGLVFGIDSCTLQGNNYGLYSRKASTASVYGNLITISRSQIASNIKAGIDFDQGAGLMLNEVDIELNGTAGDTTTGGIILGANLTQETGFSMVSLKNCWLEANKGRAIQGLSGDLSIDSTLIINSENGNSVYVNGCRQLHMIGCQVPEVGATVTIASTNTIVTLISSIISNIANSASAANTTILNTGGGSLSIQGFTSDLYVTNGHKIALTWSNGTGVATIANNTSTTDLEISAQGNVKMLKPLVLANELTVNGTGDSTFTGNLVVKGGFIKPQSGSNVGFTNSAGTFWSLKSTDTGVVTTKNQTLDDGAGNMIIKGYTTVGNVGSLPTASVTYRGQVVLVLGNGTTTADTFYICLMSATGTYSWKQIMAG